MYLAYKYVAIAVLVAEANFNAERLSLPVQRPIEGSQLTYKFMAPPQILRNGGFMGRLDASGYAFSEGGGRHYRFVTKLDPFGKLSVAEQNEKLSHEKSLISSNEAYQLATRWLKSIDVDVQGLEKTNRVDIQQRWFWSQDKPGTKTFLPIFEIEWGAGIRITPKVRVVVDGRTKEFLELRQEDDSFSKHPHELIKEVDKLLAITDGEFQGYTSAEKSNLVFRFAVNWPFASQMRMTNSTTTSGLSNLPAIK